MTIEKFVTEKTKQKAEAESVTESVTLRLASNIVGEIDDLASTLDVTRHELITEFVNDALERALTHYDEMQNKPESSVDIFLDSEPDTTQPRYVFLNTNKRNNPDAHRHMVSNGIAAAFCDPWKYKIDKLRKGDIVFLYESGVGIAGIGKANGETERLDRGNVQGETHQQKLIDYQKVSPLNARKIRKLTGTNMVFLQTMFKVKLEHGVLIQNELKPV